MASSVFVSDPAARRRRTARAADLEVSTSRVYRWTRVARANADDRLPLDPLGRIESGHGVVEGRDAADVRPQPSVTHPPDDLTGLGAIGKDNKGGRQAVRGPRLGRSGNGPQRSSGPNQACGPLPD